MSLRNFSPYHSAATGRSDCDSAGTLQQWRDSTFSSPGASNLKDFESILSKVDDAFRLRKEECKRLEWEISDLENQLDDIQNSTDEYADMAAAEGAALSWTKQTFMVLEDEWNALCFSRTEEFSLVRNALDNTIKDGTALLEYFSDLQIQWRAKLLEINNRLKDAKTSSMHFVAKLNTLQENSFLLSKAIEELSVTIELKRQTIGSISARLEYLTSLKEGLTSTEQQLSLRQSQTQRDLSTLTFDLAKLGLDLSSTEADISQEEELFIDVSSQIRSCTHLRRLGKDHCASTVAVILNDLQKLKQDYHHISEEIEMLEAQMKTLVDQKVGLEGVIDDLSNQQEQFLFYNADLDSQKVRVKQNIQMLRETLHSSLRDHEQKFQLSCNKLRELQELQSQQTNAQLRYNKAQLSLAEVANSIVHRGAQQQAFCDDLVLQEASLKADVDNLAEKRRIQEERQLLQCEDLLSRMCFISDAEQHISQNSSFLVLLKQSEDSIHEKTSLISELDNEISAADNMCDEVMQRVNEKEMHLKILHEEINLLNNTAYDKEKMQFSDQEEQEIQKQVQDEIGKVSRELQTRHDQEIYALEECREKIKQALSSNPKVLRLRDEISDLERELQFLATAVVDSPENLHEDDIYITNDKKSSSMYDPEMMENILPSNNHSDDANIFPARSNFHAKKRKFSSYVRDSGTVFSKASMEDLFADDM